MPTSQEWRSQTLIVGVHVASEEDLRFSTATFRMSGLEEWLTEPWREPPFFPAPYVVGRRRVRRRRRGPARVTSQRVTRRRRPSVVRRARAFRARREYRPAGRISGRVQGARIMALLSEHRNIEGRFREVTKRAANFQVTLDEPLGLAAWERQWILPLQDLLILCTGRESPIASLTAHFRVQVPAFVRPALADRRTMPATVSVRRANMTAPGHDGRYERMLLPRNALSCDGARFLQEWFRLHRRIVRAAPFFFATLDERSQWLQNQLLNLTSFAEAYHERMDDHPRFDPDLNSRLAYELLGRIEDLVARQAWREKTAYAAKLTQRTRLAELVAWASSVVPALERFPRLVSQLIDTRNHLTHFGPRTRWVVDDHELVRVVQRLVVVLQANMLLDLGGCAEAVASAIARGYWRSPVLDPGEEVRTPQSLA
jgi:ApeA N-terminal domain 1